MNQHALYLNRIIEQGCIPHTLLFAGPSHGSCVSSAWQFAKQLIGASSEEDHPDLYTYKPEGKLGLHSIETLRELRNEVYLPPYQAKRKAFLIFDAERMAATSSNALLKTFEEPPPTSFIILTSHFPEKLLSTVRSRCQALFFPCDEKIAHPMHPLLAPLLSSLVTTSYPTLLTQVAELASALEKEVEASPAEDQQEQTALQKQAQEKAEEGKYALALLRATESLWEEILGWYRDLHLLHLRGDPIQLLHPSYAPILIDLVEKGHLPNLDQVQKIVSQTRLSLERSAPLRNSLESLFLALKSL